MSGALLCEALKGMPNVLSKAQNEEEDRSRLARSCRKSDRYLTLHREQNKEDRTSFSKA